MNGMSATNGCNTVIYNFPSKLKTIINHESNQRNGNATESCEDAIAYLLRY